MRAALLIFPRRGDAGLSVALIVTRGMSDSSGGSQHRHRYSHYDMIIRATLMRECWFCVQKYETFRYVFKSVCHLGVSYHAISLFIAASIKPGLSLSALGTGSVQSYFLFYILLSSCFLPLVSHVYYLTGHSSSKTEHLA